MTAKKTDTIVVTRLLADDNHQWKSQWGWVTNAQWVLLEAKRMRKSGCTARVRRKTCPWPMTAKLYIEAEINLLGASYF